jgi:PEGA domain-containing protein
MTLNRMVLTTAFIAAATLASAASAQDRDAKKREAVRSAQGNGAQVNTPKTEARDNGREARQAEKQAQAQREAEVRRNDSARQAQRRDEAVRNEKRDTNASRDNNGSRDNNAYRGDNNAYAVGRAVPRSDYRNPQSVVNEKYKDAARREYRRDAAGRYYYNPGHVYYGHTYYRPYLFRPHVSIGFNIFSGYPVPYSYSYPAPIFVYGYRAPRAPVYVEPGSALYGGVALEIGPYDADVFVDGSYAGHVEDFDGTVQPLTLVAGTHRIEVQAPGYAPLVFDVTVQPGQVIPYRGDLRPF